MFQFRALSILIGVAALWAAPFCARAVELPDDCMPLSEVQIGMIGEARTAVHGFKLESYKVEILGIEKGAIAGSAMILAKMEGPYLENHGIVAGMSGSPVFINGKIIGAVAYGWSFAYRPYAGITPIEHMMTCWDDLDHPADKFPDGMTGSAGGPTGSVPVSPNSASSWNWQPEWEAYIGGGDAATKPEPLYLRPQSAEALKEFGSAPIEMVPMSAPIFVSTASERSMARLRKLFGGRGVELMSAGSSAGSNEHPDEPAPEIVAGSALGVPIMTGDSTVTTMGTVTYRRGNKLLAFGHPMFSEGVSHAPMSQAYVYGMMQSYSRSFKLGETREVVGTIRQDRAYGIGGVFGEAPPRAVMTVNAKGKAAANPRAFHYSLWKNRDFLPQIAAIAVDESYSASISQSGELTGDCNYTLKLTDGRKIQKNMRSTSQTGTSMDFIMPMIQDMFLLLNNPFKEADVASIDVELDVRPGFRFDSLQQVIPRYTTLKAGQSLDLDMRWRPFLGPEYNSRVSVPLPADLHEGMYVVHLADARGSRQIDMRHAPSTFQPHTFDETVQLAQQLNYPENRLRVYLFDPQIDIGIRTKTLEDLPASVQGLVAATSPVENQTLVTGHKLMSKDIDFDYPIQGRSTIMIEIVRYLPQ